MNSLLDFIKTIHAVSEEAQQSLLSICTELFFKKSVDVQPICHTCKTFYFIKKGALRIYYFKDITEITESFEFETSFVARAESFFFPE